MPTTQSLSHFRWWQFSLPGCSVQKPWSPSLMLRIFCWLRLQSTHTKTWITLLHFHCCHPGPSHHVFVCCLDQCSCLLVFSASTLVCTIVSAGQLKWRFSYLNQIMRLPVLAALQGLPLHMKFKAKPLSALHGPTWSVHPSHPIYLSNLLFLFSLLFSVIYLYRPPGTYWTCFCLRAFALALP